MSCNNIKYNISTILGTIIFYSDFSLDGKPPAPHDRYKSKSTYTSKLQNGISNATENKQTSVLFMNFRVTWLKIDFY